MQGVGSGTLRPVLADLVQENMLGAGEFVGEDVMPLLPVDKDTGKFAKIDFAEVKTVAVDDKKARGSGYNRVQHEVSEDDYTCRKRGLEEPVDQDDIKRLGSFFDAELVSANFCSYYLRLNREKRIADIAFDVINEMASYTTAVTTPWSTLATATPVADVQNARKALKRQINGMLARGLAKLIGIGHDDVMTSLVNCTDIKNRVYAGGNVQQKEITEQQLAGILGLDEVHFTGIQQDGANIWTNTQFGIYVVSNSAQLKNVVHFGRLFLWRESTPTDMMVETYEDKPTEAEIVRVKHNSTEKLLTARAGHVLTNVGV